MSTHVITVWIAGHALLTCAGVLLLAIVGLKLPAGRSIQRRHDRALADQGRRARSLGLDLTDREAVLLERLERPWWRRGGR